MDQTFNQWLHATYPPGRFDVLSASMESLLEFHGEMLVHWQSDLVANLGYTDTASAHLLVEQNTLQFQAETLSKFGVFLDTAQLDSSKTHFCDAMIRALYVLDTYELPNAILSIIAGDMSAEETLAEIVAEVSGHEAEDYIMILSQVNPDLIKRIKGLAEAKLVAQQESMEEIPQPETQDVEDTALRNRVFAFVREWGDDNPMVRYVEQNGKLGLEYRRYVALFQPWMSGVALDFETQSAKAWVLIALMSDLWTLTNEDIIKAIEALLSPTYGNVLRTMKVRNAFIKMLTEYRA